MLFLLRLVVHTELGTLSTTYMHFRYLKQLDWEIIFTYLLNYVVTFLPKILIKNIHRECVWFISHRVFVTVVNRKDSANNSMAVSSIIVRHDVGTCWHIFNMACSNYFKGQYCILPYISSNSLYNKQRNEIGIQPIHKGLDIHRFHEFYLFSLYRPWSYSSSISMKTFNICFD